MHTRPPSHVSLSCTHLHVHVPGVWIHNYIYYIYIYMCVWIRRTTDPKCRGWSQAQDQIRHQTSRFSSCATRRSQSSTRGTHARLGQNGTILHSTNSANLTAPTASRWVIAMVSCRKTGNARQAAVATRTGGSVQVQKAQTGLIGGTLASAAAATAGRTCVPSTTAGSRKPKLFST